VREIGFDCVVSQGGQPQQLGETPTTTIHENLNKIKLSTGERPSPRQARRFKSLFSYKEASPQTRLTLSIIIISSRTTNNTNLCYPFWSLSKALVFIDSILSRSRRRTGWVSLKLCFLLIGWLVGCN